MVTADTSFLRVDFSRARSIYQSLHMGILPMNSRKGKPLASERAFELLFNVLTLLKINSFPGYLLHVEVCLNPEHKKISTLLLLLYSILIINVTEKKFENCFSIQSLWVTLIWLHWLWLCSSSQYCSVNMPLPHLPCVVANTSASSLSHRCLMTWVWLTYLIWGQNPSSHWFSLANKHREFSTYDRIFFECTDVQNSRCSRPRVKSL